MLPFHLPALQRWHSCRCQNAGSWLHRHRLKRSGKPQATALGNAEISVGMRPPTGEVSTLGGFSRASISAEVSFSVGPNGIRKAGPGHAAIQSGSAFRPALAQEAVDLLPAGG